MYAIVEIGGHQYRVSEDDVIYVDRLSEEEDETVTFDRVLMVNDDGDVKVGKPVLDDATVEATLLDNLKDDKVIVFKKKAKKGYRVKRGHRQRLSQIRINSITAN